MTSDSFGRKSIWNCSFRGKPWRFAAIREKGKGTKGLGKKLEGRPKRIIDLIKGGPEVLLSLGLPLGRDTIFSEGKRSRKGETSSAETRTAWGSPSIERIRPSVAPGCLR